MVKSLALLPLFLLIASCADLPWKKYPMDVRPDISCRSTNGESGSDIYVWDCYKDERIVISQNISGFYRGSAEKIVSHCGTFTSFEKSKGLTPDTERTCQEKPRPFQSRDRLIAGKLVHKADNEVKDCEFLGNFIWHGDTPEEAEKAVLERIRESYADSYTNLEHLVEKDWLETIFKASAKAYNCEK